MQKILTLFVLTMLMMPLTISAQIDTNNLRPEIINGKYCYDSAGIIRVANLKKDLVSIQKQKQSLETLLEINEVNQAVYDIKMRELNQREKETRKEMKRAQRKSFRRGFGIGYISGTITILLASLLL